MPTRGRTSPASKRSTIKRSTILLHRVSIFRAVSFFHLRFEPLACSVPAVLWAAESPHAGYAPAVGAAAPAVLAGPAAAAPVAFAVAPVALAAPAVDVLLAERRAVPTARDLVAAAPAVVAPPVVVAAPAISAPAVVANDAPALAAFDFAGAARAEIGPAVARRRAVAAVTESSVVWQLPFAPAVADASSVAGPAVGPPVDPPPAQLHLELFADPTAVCAVLASAGARLGRRAQPVWPDQPFVVPALALPQGSAAESSARLRADLRSEASASSPDHSMPRLVKSGPDHA